MEKLGKLRKKNRYLAPKPHRVFHLCTRKDSEMVVNLLYYTTLLQKARLSKASDFE